METSKPPRRKKVKRYTERINPHLPSEAVARMRDLAEKEDRPLASMARKLLKLGIEKARREQEAARSCECHGNT